MLNHQRRLHADNQGDMIPYTISSHSWRRK
ncbi:unnamed protein product [Coffea canephora]|uniref:Uncharacterized protein n=1 Tax=Coffea canephora TaxID=49390 RepID=A0A068UEP4_COFCA|nr:unnamed protein product [Coffea canephora]